MPCEQGCIEGEGACKHSLHAPSSSGRMPLPVCTPVGAPLPLCATCAGRGHRLSHVELAPPPCAQTENVGGVQKVCPAPFRPSPPLSQQESEHRTPSLPLLVTDV
jgi:hypothetical protein